MQAQRLEGNEIYRRVVNTGQRWHLPAEPSTLARLLLRSQASRKEKRPTPHPHSPCPYTWNIGGGSCSEIQEHVMSL